jgi:predicted PurR-regulated permease PerM
VTALPPRTPVNSDDVVLAMRLTRVNRRRGGSASDAADGDPSALGRFEEISGTAPTAIEAPVTPDAMSPSNIRTDILFVFGLLAVCYVAGEIILPIVLAFVLTLVLRPVMRFFDRSFLPRTIAASVIIIVLFGSFVGLGAALSGPAASWAEKLPAGVPRLQERLTVLGKPIQTLQKFLHQAEGLTQGAEPVAATVAVQGSWLSDKVLNATRAIASGLFTTVLVLFFLLVSGDLFLRRLVEILPRFKDKRQAVHISQQIEEDISAYLITITIMNIAVGIATAGVASAFGLGDPLLWGTVAFLLNYVPVLGPMTGVVTFVLVGLLSIETLWLAFMPAAAYLLIHVIEGEIVTPTLLARRFTINPVLVVLALVFWYWMWGIPGAILATPMLAITKIVCDRIQTLSAIGHLIEG